MNIAVYLKFGEDYKAYAEVDMATCDGCGVCVKICPFNVPSITGDTAEISPKRCQGCGVCVPYCRTNSIHIHYTLNTEAYSSNKGDLRGLRYPLDKNALEAGLALRDMVGGTVWILAEGPPQFEESVRESLVMGADEGVLLCDPKFLGSDHVASSLILEQALKKIGDCDLLIAPQRNGHGHPAYSVAWVAERLGMSYIPFVKSLKPAGETVLVQQNWGGKLLELSVSLPAALTVERGINEPRGLSLMAAARVMGKTVSHWSSEELNLDSSQIGEAGSQVRLKSIQALPRSKGKTRKGGDMLKGSPEVLAQKLVERLKEWRVL
jgi:electron transfer flavoprotein beta subunit